MHVPYYQGRPAWLIKAAMPGHAGTAAKPPAAAAAVPDGAPRDAQATMRKEADALAPPTASSIAWKAWAANWFTAPR